MTVAYVAHPIGPDGPERVANLYRAKRWLRWLIETHPSLAFALPWLPYCEVLDESLANRERGVRDDLEMLKRCDQLVMVGGRVSPGMAIERDLAASLGRAVIDYTHLGILPPTSEASR